MIGGRSALVLSLAVAIAWTSVAGCALVRRKPAGVPVDTRPTPTAPAERPSPQTRQEDPPTTEAPTPATKSPVRETDSEADRRAAMRRIVADTTEASSAVGRCSKRKLYPDQESSYDSARGLLVQTRAALARNELWRAESLARKARQLASSLTCP